MEENTKEIGKMDVCMVMVFILGLRDSLMKEGTIWTKSKAMEATDGRMAEDT
jgi:hypothetical protein